jgi:hypothetical protein
MYKSGGFFTFLSHVQIQYGFWFPLHLQIRHHFFFPSHVQIQYGFWYPLHLQIRHHLFFLSHVRIRYAIFWFPLYLRNNRDYVTSHAWQVIMPTTTCRLQLQTAITTATANMLLRLRQQGIRGRRQWVNDNHPPHVATSDHQKTNTIGWEWHWEWAYKGTWTILYLFILLL